MIIYVLKLEEDCFYVGKTNNLDARLETHKLGNGSAWTYKHNVIELHKTFKPPSDVDADFYEDMIVKMYMRKYGIQKVRGGSYSQLYLSQEKIRLITQEIYGATDKCFRCGGDHFVKDCLETKTSIEYTPYPKPEQEIDMVTRILASAERKAKRWYSWLTN